jgi:hypothetical protein
LYHPSIYFWPYNTKTKYTSKIHFFLKLKIKKLSSGQKFASKKKVEIFDTFKGCFGGVGGGAKKSQVHLLLKK